MPTQAELFKFEQGLSGLPQACSQVQPANASQVAFEAGIASFILSCPNDAIYGCTDPQAINYNPSATADNGSCQYAPSFVPGCTDPAATNYNPLATSNDGSCQYPPPVVYGCTDSAATNYNPLATQDDGSCVYAPPQAYLRIWNMLENGDGNLTVSGPIGDAFPFIAIPHSYAQGYTLVTSGLVAINCVVSSYGDNPVHTFAMFKTLETNKYYTVFLRRSFAGPVEVFLVDDNWSVGDPARMRVYQLRANLSATGVFEGYDETDPDNPVAGTVVNLGTLADGQDMTLTGFDPTTNGANFTGVDSTTGLNLAWNTAIDFTVQRLATTLMINDPSGRWRPRIVYDGPTIG